ncbi:MAG: hypothetical protein F9K40_11935 [Kofleriaceae bacterium]|nr:MAG: hypothetical protein F9K40_11935 [Kofleriaceae bacterium]MBZ0238970.1 hypothetical protein [Kofleriaceae bacterium]
MKRVIFLLSLLAPALAPTTAGARPFGEKGQYIITSDARLDYQRDTLSIEGADDETRTRYAFRLAGDYSSFRRVTFGLDVGFEGEVQGFDSSKGFRLGGRAGYVVPLGAVSAWWIRAGVGFANTTVQTRTEEYTLRTTRLSVSAPVVFNPYPQVLIGLGPTFEHDLSAKVANDVDAPKVTGFGVHMTLGFWWE